MQPEVPESADFAKIGGLSKKPTGAVLPTLCNLGEFADMYEAFFHLNSRPFPSAPRTDRYFPASAIENSRQTLSRCIERAEGPGLLVGGPGTGKSLVCALLADQFRERFHLVKLDHARFCTRRALLQAVMFELNLPYRGLDEGELRLAMIEFAKSTDAAREGLLLVIDEAQTLPVRLIEEIRMITNVVVGGQPRLRLVLSGNSSLEERLSSPKLESLNQRIAARCYLQPLNYEETASYTRAAGRRRRRSGSNHDGRHLAGRVSRLRRHPAVDQSGLRPRVDAGRRRPTSGLGRGDHRGSLGRLAATAAALAHESPSGEGR